MMYTPNLQGDKRGSDDHLVATETYLFRGGKTSGRARLSYNDYNGAAYDPVEELWVNW